MLAIVGMGDLILTTLGVSGLYIARIFTQTQGRPLYICASSMTEIHRERETGRL